MSVLRTRQQASSDRPPITSMGVVIPAHDEEQHLGDCLRSVRAAAAAVAVPVRILVVLDDCSDGTAAVCERAGVEVRAISARSVGVARGAGFAQMLRGQIRGRWLATTDADTKVDPDWLSAQLRLADDGADAVVGTVRVEDWEHHDAPTVSRYRELYAQGLRTTAEGLAHRHVHGANLGVRATAYQDVGGFEPVELDEDQRLVAALAATPGLRVVRSRAVCVDTSARASFRAAAGFGQFLVDLTAGSEALDIPTAERAAAPAAATSDHTAAGAVPTVAGVG